MSDILINSKIELLNADEENISFASVSLNPSFQWAKIVVCDSEPNDNRQRIPEEEFDNLIKTGISSPIKMAPGKISDGHAEAFGYPIGTVSAITKIKNQVVALAALWKKERGEDITLLKDMYASGNPPQVSWEISYEKSEVASDGAMDLKGCILTGLAVVGVPAYAGRTPFVAMSSKIEKENESVDELEQAKARIAELESLLSDTKSQLAAKEEELSTTLSELTPLKEFKASIDKENADKARLEEVREKFKVAGIEKEDSYFVSNRDKILALDNNALDFMIQELVVSFATASRTEDTQEDATRIPAFRGTVERPSIREVARLMKERETKK